MGSISVEVDGSVSFLPVSTSLSDLALPELFIANAQAFWNATCIIFACPLSIIDIYMANI